MSIQFYTSLIFDAICTCNHLTGTLPTYGNEVQNNIVSILKEQAGDRFSDGALSYSNLSAIVYLCADHKRMNLESLSHFFEHIADAEPILHENVQNGFRASFLFPTMEMLKEKWGAIYARYLRDLREMDFESVWNENIHTVEEEQICKLVQSTARFDSNEMLSLISKLKGRDIANEVEVFVSLMSYPVSFMLSDTAFLDTINDPDYFPSMVAHELMHGFSSKELTELYRNLMNQSNYLRTSHRMLIHDMHSGDEEEFVMAAEYYITWKLGIYTREEIVLKNYDRYGGCVPLALCIFDYLCKEPEIPNYPEYLIRVLHTNHLSTASIIRTIHEMLPQPVNEDTFYANLFVILQRCAIITRGAQLEKDPGLCEQIEAMTGAQFHPNANAVVVFANGEKVLPEEETVRKTLTASHLTVDAITFSDQKSAFQLNFPYGGCNVGPYPATIDGEKVKRPYIFNLSSGKKQPVRAEFSFVRGNTRFLITSEVKDPTLTDWSTEASPRDLECILDAVRIAEKIVLLQNIGKA